MSSLPVQRDLSVLRAQAETSWRRKNPKLVKQLEKSGKLDQVLNGVAEQAAIILEQAHAANLPDDCAQELVNQVIYPRAERTREDEELDSQPW
jgi:hypothetical protein